MNYAVIFDLMLSAYITLVTSACLYLASYLYIRIYMYTHRSHICHELFYYVAYSDVWGLKLLLVTDYLEVHG